MVVDGILFKEPVIEMSVVFLNSGAFILEAFSWMYMNEPDP